MSEHATTEPPRQAPLPRPTLAAVAALAAVSRSTASIAFSGSGPVSPDTRARVLAAAAQLGYGGPDPMARSLRRGRSGIVGVVIEDRLRDAFRDVMNIAMLDGIADEIGARGNSLLLLTDTPLGSDSEASSGADAAAPAARTNSPSRAEGVLLADAAAGTRAVATPGAETGPAAGAAPESGATALATAPLDGVVLIGCSTRLDHAVEVLRRRGIPIVAVEAEPMAGVLEVALDNRAASATGAHHLHELGHRDVAVVALPLAEPCRAGPLPAGWEHTATAYTAAERLRGVRDVFGDVPGRTTLASTVEEGYLAGRELLGAASRPSAIIAQSDLLALGVLQAAEELGVAVPGELSVLGFDGIRTDGYSRRVLSTLVQPAVEKGRAAGRAVVGLLAGEPVEPVLLHCELRVGDTTGPAA